MANSKYKLPKKPKLKKMPAKPKQPKSGIKTDAQLKAFEARVNEWQKKCSVIGKENKALLSAYNKKVAEIEKRKKADAKAKSDFKKRIEAVKKKLSTCSV
ncbi:MAG: hypothetical protein L3J35_03660 [Bacteroidales bacterium]|nr:hypothetical protein [Bacteroidales bacterium]